MLSFKSKVILNNTCTYLFLKYVKTLGPLEEFKGWTHSCYDNTRHKPIQKRNSNIVHSHPGL